MEQLSFVYLAHRHTKSGRKWVKVGVGVVGLPLQTLFGGGSNNSNVQLSQNTLRFTSTMWKWREKLGKLGGKQENSEWPTGVPSPLFPIAPAVCLLVFTQVLCIEVHFGM